MNRYPQSAAGDFKIGVNRQWKTVWRIAPLTSPHFGLRYFVLKRGWRRTYGGPFGSIAEAMDSLRRFLK